MNYTAQVISHSQRMKQCMDDSLVLMVCVSASFIIPCDWFIHSWMLVIWKGLGMYLVFFFFLLMFLLSFLLFGYFPLHIPIFIYSFASFSSCEYSFLCLDNILRGSPMPSNFYPREYFTAIWQNLSHPWIHLSWTRLFFNMEWSTSLNC